MNSYAFHMNDHILTQSSYHAKEAVNFKESKDEYTEGLGGGEGRCICHNYIIISKKVLKILKSSTLWKILRLGLLRNLKRIN